VLVVFTVVRYAVWIGLAAAIVALLAVLWKFTGWLDRQLERQEDRRAAARAARAEIARRADEQHALVLGGDERGTYGNYPPHLKDVPRHG
jgi:hypothetical protein